MGVIRKIFLLLMMPLLSYGYWRTGIQDFLESPEWEACRDAAVIDAAASTNILDIGVYQIPIEVIGLSVNGIPQLDEGDQSWNPLTLEIMHKIVKHLNQSFWGENGIPIYFFESGLRGAGNGVRFLDISEKAFNAYESIGWDMLAPVFSDSRCFTYLITQNSSLGFKPIWGGETHYVAGFATLSCDNETGMFEIAAAHETGHMLGLKHTFANSLADFEYPDGSNSLNVTDGLTDTPSTIIGQPAYNGTIELGVPAMSGLRSGEDCTYYPDGGSWPSNSVVYQWLATHPTFDKYDFVMDWNNLMGYNGWTAWEISEQQAWLMKEVLDWMKINSSAGVGLTPASIQIYDAITPTITGSPPTNISWARITNDRQGYIGFPDEYQVFSRTALNGTWMLRTTIDATGLLDSYSYVPSVTDPYWRVQAIDTQSGFTWEWPTAKWADYIFWTSDETFNNTGYLRGDCH